MLFTEEIRREIRKYFEMDENETMTYQKVEMKLKRLRGKFIAVNAYIKKEFHLKVLEKEEPTKAKTSTRKKR